jgi:hypothetical protein
MEALTALPEVTKACLKGAQCCHLYLQVSTLADITNSADTHLPDWVTKLKYAPPLQCHAMLMYPNQACPSMTVWNDFVQLLQLAFTEGTSNRLQHPLGNWYCGHISQSWNQVFSIADHKIYSLEQEPCRSICIYEKQYN